MRAKSHFKWFLIIAMVGLAARQIAREVGAIHVVPEWRELKEMRGAEWERGNLAGAATARC